MLKTKDIVFIRGGGDIATGIAHKLYRCGFRVLVLEIEWPTVVRRKVSFAQAIFDGETVVEGVKAVKVINEEEIFMSWENDCIPVLIDSELNILEKIKPDILVDSILAKRNLGTNKRMAPITIGVGPGFKAGEDVHVVVETNRGHNLGKLIFDGFAEPNTKIPQEVMGYTSERVLRAPCDGIIKNVFDIGDYVSKGQIVAYVNGEPVKALINGVLRGLIMNNSEVKKGLKIGDIDPRKIKEYCFTISDKARAVGGGVLEAILYLKTRRGRF